MTPSIATRVFTGASPGPHVVVTAGVHGDEFEPIAAVLRLAALFESESSPTPDLRGRLTFVPVANGPAFVRGSRTGDDELDLARTCPGRADGSTTQRLAAELSELIATADYYIDLHSGGAVLTLLPFAGYMLHADASVLDAQRRMARAFGLPLVWGTTASLEGRTLSVARDAGVPAIYAEYGGGGSCDWRGVATFVTGCLNVLGVVGSLDRTAPAVVQRIVEDDRPGAGHLQNRYPSPAEGLFEPVVHVGDSIDIGNLVGHAIDPLTGSRTEVCATESGCVLAIRSFPRVRAGDSLAVILEYDPGTRG